MEDCENGTQNMAFRREGSQGGECKPHPIYLKP